MGRLTPAWASSFLAAAVLIGLAFVSVPSADRTAPVAAPAPAPRPAPLSAPVPVVAANPANVPTTVRAAVARRHPGHAPCGAGLIALTFDDGPSPSVTPKLVRTLVRLKVPATFFMVGSRVDAHPDVARMVQEAGFTIGNHTWNHPQLTHLSNPEIRDQVLATSSAFKRHFITPSHLMRPPFGAINPRVRNVVRGLDLVPVLWTNDSLDWSGGNAITIAHRILVALRPHGTNLVLQHDGVDNSPASLAAVPIVIRKARERGFCFTHLNGAGGVGGGRPPRSVTPIVPTGTGPRQPSTTTVRATSADASVTATRRSTLRLYFASRAALQMPASAYLNQLRSKLSHPRH